jgi:hypothetical protein
MHTAIKNFNEASSKALKVTCSEGEEAEANLREIGPFDPHSSWIMRPIPTTLLILYTPKVGDRAAAMNSWLFATSADAERCESTIRKVKKLVLEGASA